jgi:hypothetical protein
MTLYLDRMGKTNPYYFSPQVKKTIRAPGNHHLFLRKVLLRTVTSAKRCRCIFGPDVFCLFEARAPAFVIV